MTKIKLILISLVLLVILGLSGTVYFQHNQLDNLKVELTTANHNYSALENENLSLRDKNLTFQLTVDQLSNSKDSLVNEMNKVRKELKVKDKELKELAYLASEASRADTIYLKEFVIEPQAPIDTTLKDKWYELNVSVNPPNELIINPKFKSEKYIVSYLRKETVNPSKCKFINLFKKKESILEVEVVEKSPYITNTKEKFIEKL